MSFSTIVSVRPSIQGQLKLARLLKMPEKDFESQIKEVESSPLFQILLNARAVAISPYTDARFGIRRSAGPSLMSSSENLPELMDGHGDMIPLIRQIGQENFEFYFLGDENLSDEKRAQLCGISLNEARRLREFVNRLYIQTEFQASADSAIPAKVFSAVAGIEIQDGQPVLAFFNREIWKGRYRVDKDRCKGLKASLPLKEAARLDGLVRRLEIFELRKSTLYRALEALLEEQSEYLVSGHPERRRPLTQRALASRLNIDPGVLNRLISNKSVRLPWGLEAPLKALCPSAKTILRGKLHDLIEKRPRLSDRQLAKEMENLFSFALSRRSIAQYRNELGLRKKPIISGKTAQTSKGKTHSAVTARHPRKSFELPSKIFQPPRGR